MQIEIHLPSGRLLAVETRLTYGMFGRWGSGKSAVALYCQCIPHSTMCGPFSRDQRIAQQAVILGKATATRGSADYCAMQYTSKYGLIKP